MSKHDLKTHFDIIIIGSGHSGLSAALAFSKEGFKTAIIDRSPKENFTQSSNDPRTTALAYATSNFYSHLGLWDAIQRVSSPIHDIRVSDVRSSLFVHFDHEEPNVRNTSSHHNPAFGHIIENKELSRILIAATEAEPLITYYDASTITHLERQNERVFIHFSWGKEELSLSCDLLVGADGRGSFVRKWANIDHQIYDYHQSAIVCTISHTKPHQHVAIEHFHPSGPFALLPMTHNRMSVIWSEPFSKAQKIMNLPQDQILAKLKSKIKMNLGDIQISSPILTYPLSLSFAGDYISEQVALIGDAAHGIHPLAGQGFNLGVRDIAVLCELLSEAKKLGYPLGNIDMLSQYQQFRHFDNHLMLWATDLINRIFLVSNPLLRHFRNIGFAFVNKTKFMKNFFINEAMGRQGKVPLLLQPIS